MNTDSYIFNPQGEILAIVPSSKTAVNTIYQKDFGELFYISLCTPSNRIWWDNKFNDVSEDDVPAAVKASLLLII
jgi:hypothetical protein